MTILTDVNAGICRAIDAGAPRERLRLRMGRPALLALSAATGCHLSGAPLPASYGDIPIEEVSCPTRYEDKPGPDSFFGWELAW